MTITQVKLLKDAVAAHCESCDTWIEYNGYWSLAKSIGLHKRGSCAEPKITYWAFST